MTIEQNSANYGVIIVCVLVVILLVIVALPILFTDHAVSSHTEYLNDINNCFDHGDNNAITSWLRSNKRGNWIEICNDGGKHNYFRVYDCDDNELRVVTQFPQALRRLGAYLTNNEYVNSGEPPCK